MRHGWRQLSIFKMRSMAWVGVHISPESLMVRRDSALSRTPSDTENTAGYSYTHSSAHSPQCLSNITNIINSPWCCIFNTKLIGRQTLNSGSGHKRHAVSNPKDQTRKTNPFIQQFNWRLSHCSAAKIPTALAQLLLRRKLLTWFMPSFYLKLP